MASHKKASREMLRCCSGRRQGNARVAGAKGRQHRLRQSIDAKRLQQKARRSRRKRVGGRRMGATDDHRNTEPARYVARRRQPVRSIGECDIDKGQIRVMKFRQSDGFRSGAGNAAYGVAELLEIRELLRLSA